MKSNEVTASFPDEKSTTLLAKEIKSYSTFLPHGVDERTAINYLHSDDGLRYQEALKAASPELSHGKIIEISIEHIQSGRTLPELETINEPLVKIIKSGNSVSPYTPYFAKLSDLQQIIESGESLSNRLGLPAACIAVKAI